MKRLATGALLGATLALLVAVTLAVAQGGPGFFIAPSCSTLANKVTGQTWCAESTAPYPFGVWNGTAFVSASLGGPYAPSSFGSGVLMGNGSGPILATLTPIVTRIDTTGSGAGSTGFLSNAQYSGLEPWGIGAGQTGEWYFSELAANGTNYLSFKAPDALATDFTFVWPNSVGLNGLCLATDGALPVAQLSWVACAGGGGGSGITSLGGLVALIQTFVNDTNLTMTSSGSTHTLGWTGTLAPSRGGTGRATLTANAVLAGDGTAAVKMIPLGLSGESLQSNGSVLGFAPISLPSAGATIGLLRTDRLGTGTASASTFLRGDQTWAGASGLPVYNYVYNSDMETWGGGVAAPPTGWTLVGAGGSAARTTTAGQVKIGTAAVTLTRSGANMGIAQNFALVYPPASFWQNQVVTCGAWARAVVATRARVLLSDGVVVTASAFHTGGGTFEFLTVSASISNIATTATITLDVSNGDTTVQYDGAICVLGGSITNWQPSGWVGRSGTIVHTSVSIELGANSTGHIGFFLDDPGVATDNEADVAVAMPYRAVVKTLTPRVSNPPGGVTTATFTLRNNGADTALTCQIAGVNQQCSDTTNETVIAKGNRTATKIITSIGAVPLAANAVIEFTEVPEGI